MEGIDAYGFHQELNHQTSMNNPKTRILETISSWLDLDLPNTPSFPQELQDLQMLDEHFFQFATTHMDSEPLPNLPRPDSPFILDLHEFDVNNPPPPNNSFTEKPTNTDCYQPAVPVPDECEMFLNVMAESPESIGGVDQFFQSDDHDDDQNFNIMSNSSSSTELDKINKKQKKQQQQQPQSSDPHHESTNTTNVDDDDDEDQEIEDEPKRGTLNCKNLVSERNRRKRLSQQLLALRALVPNITKMDKRSVLVDALSYLKNMQEETARIQKELKEQQHHHQQQQQQQLQHQPSGFMTETSLDDDSPSANRIPRILATGGASKPKPQILEIDIEKIEEKRFIVKITCKGANGIGGDVLRVIESLGFEITYAALDQIKPQHVLTTIFLRVKKQEKMTEEKLKDCIISSALRSGFTLQRC